ncbi:hypothetical protein PDIDSM_5089 [Penicillium digitatum]|nr:hypothetical protein PDIDSM_5089 [Penicillium digitatum]
MIHRQEILINRLDKRQRAMRYKKRLAIDNMQSERHYGHTEHERSNQILFFGYLQRPESRNRQCSSPVPDFDTCLGVLRVLVSEEYGGTGDCGVFQDRRGAGLEKVLNETTVVRFVEA